ncbi:MAG: protein phosphatase 2C domain-containing protein [Bacillota bacterium]|nr:protein phosphatase 2C domain-containing protein [Bacillota bacterium]
MTTGSYSMMGSKHKVNQDSFYLCNEDRRCLCVIADGMGGHNAGDVASKTVTEIFSKIKKFDEKTILNTIEEADRTIKSMSLCDKSLEGMGTTIVLAALNKNSAVIANVGDSRAYGINKKIVKQITSDHSYVQQLIDEGKITSFEAEHHPMKNIITMAIGTGGNIKPNVINVIFDDEDILLLCSDGVSGALSEEEMQRCCFEHMPQQSAEEICRLAVKKGATDDVTAIVVRMK